MKGWRIDVDYETEKITVEWHGGKDTEPRGVKFSWLVLQDMAPAARDKFIRSVLQADLRHMNAGVVRAVVALIGDKFA